VVFEPREQFLGFGELALDHPQFSELRERLSAQVRLAGLADVQGGSQLLLRLRPPALAQQDAAEVRAAGGVKVQVAVALGEPVGGADPLHRALELQSAGARRDRSAPGEDDGVQAPALPRQRAGHRLVEQRDAFGHPAKLDQRVSELAQRAEFEVRVAC
jgi:hypothetical protein